MLNDPYLYITFVNSEYSEALYAAISHSSMHAETDIHCSYSWIGETNRRSKAAIHAVPLDPLTATSRQSSKSVLPKVRWTDHGFKMATHRLQDELLPAEPLQPFYCCLL